MLPKINISDLYGRLPAEHTMQVALPRFRLQYRQELQEPLTSLGRKPSGFRQEYNAVQYIITQRARYRVLIWVFRVQI